MNLKLSKTTEHKYQVVTITPLISLIDTKKKLITITGIYSFDVLDEIVDLHKKYFLDQRTHRLNLKERIITVFLKLKQGLSCLFKYII
jgi:hypothetical protein